MTLALLSARNVAILTEVAMIIAGVWFAAFVRQAILEILAAGAWPTSEPDRPGHS